jgi:hypothetical protein
MSVSQMTKIIDIAEPEPEKPEPEKPIFDHGAAADEPLTQPMTMAQLEAKLPAFQRPKELLKIPYLSPEAYDRRERAAHAKANARGYRGRAAGSSSHRSESRIRAFTSADGLSVKGGFASLARGGYPGVDDEPTAPKRPAEPPCRPTVASPIRCCAHCHEKLPYRMRAGAKFCPGGNCEKAASRHAKQAAIEEAERVFQTDRLIAANSAAFDAGSTPEWEAWYRAEKLWQHRHENRRGHRGPTHRGFTGSFR